MNLTPYVDALRSQLAAVADTGGAEARAAIERLVPALEAATRVVLLEALSAATDEITRELAPGSVEVRLRGSDPDFVVAVPSFAADDTAPPGRAATYAGDEGATSRLNLRLPDGLKARIEEAARRDGLSLNAWLVGVAAAAVDGRHTPPPGPSRTGKQTFTGWVQ